jgi:ABC-type multidrug transport system ATPase subunit/ABC-type multidrug transport system permease subunit
MSHPNTPFGGPTPTFAQSVDVGVSWSGIKYTVGEREILKGLSGNALPRRSLAIMGSSGAGKTTFLNALSDRLASNGKNIKLEGKRFLNDVEYERKFRTMVGYVTQDDVLNPMATPVEALMFSLRVRRGLGVEEASAQVETMIEELGLTGARDTIVGIPGIVTGLSGGERKRTNIGIELITNPKVLYLDEPTSGLDSVTAAKICQLMKKLASRGRTVIYTIHQPTAECVGYFDDLMLMCKGQVVYHGPMAEAVDYFTDIGYACPSTHTPTDFFMTLLQDDQIADILIEKWADFLEKRNPEEYAYTAPVALTNDSFTERYLSSYAAAARGTLWIEFVELLKRSVRGVTRNKLLIGASVIQNLVFGLIVGLLFIRLKDDVTGISDRMGLLFMIITNAAFSSVMSMINNFPPQKAVFIRDQQSGAYSPLLYFICLSLAELPLQVMGLFLQAVLVYWLTDLIPQADNFFLFYAILLCVSQVGVGFGLAISTSIDSFIVASGVTPMIILPFMLMGGLLASTDRLRPYWYWLEKPSFIRAGFLLMMKNEFTELDSISCNANKFGADFCSRQPKNGNEVLRSFGFADAQSDIWPQWIVLAGIFILARFVCVAFLYRIARRKS